MVPAEPTDARTFIMLKEIEEEALLYDFGLPSIDNTKQKHQKEESKHANTPLKATAAIQKPSRDQLFEYPGLLAQKITLVQPER